MDKPKIIFLFGVYLLFFYICTFCIMIFLYVLDGDKSYSPDATITEIGVCLEDNDNYQYRIPKGVQTIYICGQLETSETTKLFIYIYKDEAKRPEFQSPDNIIYEAGEFMVKVNIKDLDPPGHYIIRAYFSRDIEIETDFYIE